MAKRWLAVAEVVIASSMFLVLLLVLLAPGLCGYLLQADIERYFASQRSSTIVERLSYHRGWFESQLHVRLNLPSRSFVLQTRFTHGPLYFGGQPHLPSKLKAYMQTHIRPLASPEEEPTTMLARLEMALSFGNALSGMLFPHYFSTSADNAGINFQWIPASRQLSAQYRLRQLTFEYNQQSIQLSNAIIALDLQHYAQWLWLGDLRISIDALHLGSTEHHASLTLDDVRIKFDATENSNKLHYQFSSQAALLRLGERDYGQNEFNFIIRNLDKSLWPSVWASLNDSPAYNDAGSLFGQLPSLLAEAELELSRLYTELPQGYIDAWFRLSMEQGTAMPMDPLLLFNALRFTGEFSIAQNLLDTLYRNYAMQMLKRTDQTQPDRLTGLDKTQLQAYAAHEASAKLESLRNQHYLELHRGQYISSLELKNGEFKINGHAFNPMQWILPH